MNTKRNFETVSLRERIRAGLVQARRATGTADGRNALLLVLASRSAAVAGDDEGRTGRRLFAAGSLGSGRTVHSTVQRWLRVAPLLALLLLRLASPALAQAVARVDGVAAVGFTVSDMNRSIEFFMNVLEFRQVSDTEVAGTEIEHLTGVFPVRMRVVGLELGNERIELTEYLAPRGRPVPVDMKSNDRAFQHIAIVVSDMDAAYRRLRQFHVEHVSPGPQRLPDWNPNAGGIQAFYFRDPDEHVLEIIRFPSGKGDPRWQGQTGHLFLGIDHTAIVVNDTEASLRFYRDALGLRVAGESENWGEEQERLNAAFGAHLRITGLRSAAGPGIEFLEYLSPSDGRPMPQDERASDIFHWQTTLVTRDANAAADALRMARYRFVSAGVVELPDASLGFDRGFLVRDPDGHVMQLAQVMRSARTGTLTGKDESR
jgi:catechol 2,3-dioxygenase-like lactoylglutathione lyase family enzyme